MLLKNTTWFAAFFLMMAIMSNCYAINTTLVVGDYASSEHDGPSGDSVFTDNSHNFGQTIAIHKETALRQITVFNWYPASSTLWRCSVTAAATTPTFN
ncbi:hypothetical protein QGM53_18075 [Salmonella enterica subsp. enterica serovar Adelaide]|nr:hypothetical protein QGM53_18075 [Salmonella enterica subsp. enterica serovar Adelaide]